MDKPRIAKEQKREGGLGTDRDFLHSAVHTVGSDRCERKGDFLDGGSNVGDFFVDLGSSLGNLMEEISWYSAMMHGFTDLRSIAVDVLVGGWDAATFLGSEGSLQDLSSSKTVRTGGFGRAIG